MLFGRQKGGEKTFLILDIENGSVAAALAHVSPHAQPTIWGVRRIEIPLLPSVDAAALASHIENAVREAIGSASLLAGRLRNAPVASAQLNAAGDIAHTAIFLAAPWGTPNLREGRPDFVSGMQHFLRSELASFTEAPLSFYTAAGAAGSGVMNVHPHAQSLIFLVQGELIEIVLAGEQRVKGYATLPVGYRTILRTLTTHGGLSAAEARSALRLSSSMPDHEALAAAADHLSATLRPTLEQLIGSNDVPTQLTVVSHGVVGDWLARTLASDDALAALFPQGGEIRALKSHHLAPHLAGPAPDVMLGLDALYLDHLQKQKII